MAIEIILIVIGCIELLHCILRGWTHLQRETYCKKTKRQRAELELAILQERKNRRKKNDSFNRV